MSRIQISDVSDELELVITAQQLREIREWTLQEYIVDTVVDLGMNTVGGTVVASAVSGYLTAADRPRLDSAPPNHAD